MLQSVASERGPDMMWLYVEAIKWALWKLGVLASSEIMGPIELATGLGKLTLAENSLRGNRAPSRGFAAGCAGRNVAQSL